MNSKQQELRAAAERRVAQRRGFQMHLTIYLLVNAGLWIIWYLAMPLINVGVPWPIFPTLGWGVGIVAHGLTTYWSLSGADDAAVEREMERLRGG
jgi:hypothetical protein